MCDLLPATPPVVARKRRSGRRIILWAVLVLVLSPFLYMAGSFGYWQFWGRWREITNRKRLILYKVNASAVLAACRQIRAGRTRFRPDPNWHSSDQEHPDLTDPRMPPIIGTIHPSYIVIMPQGVQIELGGGLEHFGLAETVGGAPRPMWAVKQLVPGLWYYAEDGRVPPP